MRFWALYGLTIAEIEVKTADGVNVALNKPCNASSTYPDHVCSLAVDGNTGSDGDNNFLSQYMDGRDYMIIDLGAQYVITTAVFYPRKGDLVYAQLQLIGPDNIVTAHRTIENDVIQTFNFSTTETSLPQYKIECETEFEGGS